MCASFVSLASFIFNCLRRSSVVLGLFKKDVDRWRMLFCDRPERGPRVCVYTCVLVFFSMYLTHAHTFKNLSPGCTDLRALVLSVLSWHNGWAPPAQCKDI